MELNGSQLTQALSQHRDLLASLNGGPQLAGQLSIQVELNGSWSRKTSDILNCCQSSYGQFRFDAPLAKCGRKFIKNFSLNI